MAALCVCLLTQVLFLLCPGAFGACGQESALDATTPGVLEALSGSCVQIPCNFTPTSTKPDETFDASKVVIGVWIKNDPNFGSNRDNVIFNSSVPDKNSPIKITGNLNKRNCTTLFSDLTTVNTSIYYFRVENKPYLATAVCDPLRLTVKDSPWSPSLEVSGNQTEAEVVTITCSAVTPCPHAGPQVTWNLQQGTVNNETNPDRTLRTTIKVTITLTDSHDGQLINCSAAYPVSGGFKTAESNITLSVTYGPKDTSVQVSLSGTLSAGQSVTLNCSSRAKPPVHKFTWFRLSSLGSESVGEGETYNFNLTENGDYYCVASNGVKNDSSEVIQLRIEEPIPWDAILGVVIGLLLVLCLAVFVWYFRSKRRASRETQGEPFEQPDKAAEEDESVHYGEIDFSKFSPKAVPASDTEQEETVYSQVKTSKPKTTQATENMDELYAQVKK